MEASDEVERLRVQLSKAQADNARLAAALWTLTSNLDAKIGIGAYMDVMGWVVDAKEALSGRGTALRDLLAPTVAVLEQHYSAGHVDHTAVARQLSRLRALTEEKV